jgi:hypothetical protein
MKYIMTIMSTIKISGLPNNVCAAVGGVPGVPAGAAAGGVAVASASNAFNTFKCIVKSGRTLYDSGGVWQALSAEPNEPKMDLRKITLNIQATTPEPCVNP